MAVDRVGVAGATPGIACGNADVLGFIRSNFHYKAENYLRSDITIADVFDIRQKRLELRDETRPVEREYCRATVLTSDGRKRPLWYLIERGWGFAGFGSNIEYCLSGLDPWHVHGAQCASLR
ncbi:MAG TPA: hypothetical protein VL202_03400 [Pararhizobium sp.]|nr:hypothetical protein [Pararhizobium sp.]HTO30217.1 hypothetical protein [Pararhizobium sp.]